MCKHIAAVSYGIGARLDERPELLFRLCRVRPRHLDDSILLNCLSVTFASSRFCSCS